MKTTDTDFWETLTTSKSYPFKLPTEDTTIAKDIDSSKDVDTDDSTLSIKTLIDTMVTGVLPAGVCTQKSRTLTPIVDAKNTDLDVDGSSTEESVVTPTVSSKTITGDTPVKDTGHGKRKKTANNFYTSDQFWQHHDNNDPNDDGVFLP